MTYDHLNRNSVKVAAESAQNWLSDRIKTIKSFMQLSEEVDTCKPFDMDRTRPHLKGDPRKLRLRLTLNWERLWKDRSGAQRNPSSRSPKEQNPSIWIISCSACIFRYCVQIVSGFELFREWVCWEKRHTNYDENTSNMQFECYQHPILEFHRENI